MLNLEPIKMRLDEPRSIDERHSYLWSADLRRMRAMIDEIERLRAVVDIVLKHQEGEPKAVIPMTYKLREALEKCKE